MVYAILRVWLRGERESGLRGGGEGRRYRWLRGGRRLRSRRNDHHRGCGMDCLLEGMHRGLGADDIRHHGTTPAQGKGADNQTDVKVQFSRRHEIDYHR